jgi:GDP-L-fucose synthase
MNILLTGGSGFLGKNIRESFLAQKYSLFAPAHKELELMDEFAVRSYCIDHAIDIIIHAAAKPGHRNAKDPTNIFYWNTRMFFNLARNLDIVRKMIIIGSGAIYDMRYYLPRMKEEYFGEHVPVDEHGLSKYVIGKYSEHHDRIIDLRIFGIFGKYEDYAIRFISNMICKAIFDLPLTIKQNRRFDYLFVEDLMPVLDYFIKYESRHHAYNVTPDESVELYWLAEGIREIAGKNLPIVVTNQGMGMEYSGDNNRLKNEARGIKFTPIMTAIGKLFEWYNENRHLIDRKLLLIDK